MEAVESTIIVLICMGLVLRGQSLLIDGYTGHEKENTKLSPRLLAPDASSTNKVAFMAVLTNSLINPPAGQLVIFDKETLDLNNDYDSDTGVFTAPVSGTYHFNMALTSPPSKTNHHLWVDIMTNGVESGYLFLDSHTQYWLKRTESVVLHLDEGDHVYAKVTNGDGQHVIAGLDSHGHTHHSHFSGFLVVSD